MSFEVVLSQQQQPETRAVVTSEEGIDRPLNAEAQGNIENNSIDLNKTPRQKPKRKKHRPKVIREGKPKRTPKPATPKPLNPSGKRKYVRRNKVQVPPSGNPSDDPGEEAATPPGSSDGTKSVRRSVKNTQDNPTGKRKYVRKKKIENSSDDPLSMPGGTADPESRHGTKSVRRCLNFDAEAPKARDGFPESVLMFTNNAGYQAQESCTAGNTINIDVAPSSHYARAVAAADNIAPGYPIVLNSAKDRVTNEYIRFVENPSPNPQHCRRETVRADQILRESRTMPENPTTPPRPHKRENLKKLARKNFLRITSKPDRSQEADINQFDSHETPNSLLRRTQNNHILDPDAPNSTNTKSMHAYDGVEGLGELHGATCNDPYVSQRYKKQRIEHEYGFTSAAALTCMPLNDFRTHQRESNTAEVFTSADPQNFRAPKISEDVPAIYQTTNSAAKRSEPSFEVHSAYSLSSSVNFGHIRKHGNQPGQYAMDHNKLSSSPQPFSGTDGRESQNHEFLTCMQNQVASNKSRTRTKQQRKKEEVQLVNHLINANQVEFQRQVAASCRFKNCPDQKIPEATSLFSQDFRTEVTHTSSGSCLNPGAIVLYGDPLDDIIWKLRHLTINGLCKADTAKTQKAIVPYEGAGVIIPYKGLFDLAKKRRPRPKVDLDPETNRVWNLLMGKEVGDGTERDKEKWWAEERRVFCGRVDSFIARMHLVQGDRRFSRWKGSVVDSVVGVFLTQNVSDHLSRKPSSDSLSDWNKLIVKRKSRKLKFQKEEKRQCEVESTKQAVQFQLQEQNSDNQQNFPNLHNNGNPLEVSERVQLDLKDDVYVSKKISAETPKRKSKEKKLKDENERKKNHDWDSLRKEVNRDGTKERIHGTMDSVNWEAVRCAEVNEISETIRERGMNNMLAERIKKYLWPRLCKLDQRTL
ncbi:hypothetical protein BHM03_00013166 [Ensete ventricosum]|nr:hypothetical protein BHM03_00013166 [Ensete ventricosum]